MGVRLLSRRARGPVRSMGIDPAKRPARDAQVVDHSCALAERARMSRRARGPVRSMGIDPANRPVRGVQVNSHLHERVEQISTRSAA